MWVTIAFLGLHPVYAAARQSQPVLTVDDRFRFIEVGSPILSPDGQRVLYSRTGLSLAQNRRRTTTWLASVTTGRQHEFLQEGDRILTWAPDSRSVFFIRRIEVDGKTSEELFEQGVEDSVARQRSRLGEADLGNNWQLSPDARFFLLTRNESSPSGPGAELRALFVYEGSNGQTRDYWSNLWRYDLDSGGLSRVTNREWAIGGADLAPDGQRAVVAARPDNERNTGCGGSSGVLPGPIQRSGGNGAA
jgi:dipeptidyl aminopeptidase/acylaminoacyl peptidase